MKHMIRKLLSNIDTFSCQKIKKSPTASKISDEIKEF